MAGRRAQIRSFGAGWLRPERFLDDVVLPSSRFTVEAVEQVAAGFGDEQLKIA